MRYALIIEVSRSNTYLNGSNLMALRNFVDLLSKVLFITIRCNLQYEYYMYYTFY